MEIYYTFQNTHVVISAEKAMLAAGIPIKVRPVPTAITAGCGLCLCINQNQKKQTEDELKKHSIVFSAAYLFDSGSFVLLD